MSKYLLIFLCVVSSLLNGQFKENYTPDPRLKLMSGDVRGENSSFFDMNKFTLNHSYTMAYSSGQESMGMGEYVASIGYRFSKPVTLNFQVGAYHIPYSTFDIEDGERTKVYLKSASLDWKISKNSFLHIGFNTCNGFRNNYYSPFRTFDSTNEEIKNTTEDTDLFE